MIGTRARNAFFLSFNNFEFFKCTWRSWHHLFNTPLRRNAQERLSAPFQEAFLAFLASLFRVFSHTFYTFQAFFSQLVCILQNNTIVCVIQVQKGLSSDRIESSDPVLFIACLPSNLGYNA